MKKNTAFLNIGWPYLQQTYTIIFFLKQSTPSLYTKIEETRELFTNWTKNLTKIK